MFYYILSIIVGRYLKVDYISIKIKDFDFCCCNISIYKCPWHSSSFWVQLSYEKYIYLNWELNTCFSKIDYFNLMIHDITNSKNN